MADEAAHSPAGAGRPCLTRADRVALALVLGWVAACFVQTLGFGFVNWDDHDFVLKNPVVTHPGNVPLLHHFTTPEVGYPMPVTIASYRVEHALAGFDHPWVQHLTNLLVHLGSVALLFALARTLGIGTLGAVLAASLLGVHPIVAEPVSWVTGRKDLLALFFSLATVLLFLGGRSRLRRIGRAATFLLALFSKPVAVALVPILLLLAFADQERSQPWARRLAGAVKANALEILVGLAYLPLTWLGYRAFGAARSGEEVTVSLRSAWYGLGAHLSLLLGIEPPCVQHLTEVFPPPFTARFDLLPVLVAALVGLGLWRLRGRPRRIAAAALSCSLLAYLPSSGLVPIKRFIADSYVYPVLPGLGLALGLLVEELPWRLGRRLLVPALAVGLGLLVMPASGRFRTTRDLWADARERYPDSWRMCRNWAVAMQEIGGPGRTLAATDECIAKFGADNFEKNRAVALFELGRREEAAEWMRRALARDPRDRNVPAELLQLAEMHRN
jgi:tetratricopeptide (TPR) repeat protein